MSEPDLCHWRAVIALEDAELFGADPHPLPAWAREHMASGPDSDQHAPRPWEHRGVIVAATGQLLAATEQNPKGSRMYDALLDGGPVSLSPAMFELRRRTGGPVAHVRGWQVCVGAVPLHLRGPRV